MSASIWWAADDSRCDGSLLKNTASRMLLAVSEAGVSSAQGGNSQKLFVITSVRRKVG